MEYVISSLMPAVTAERCPLHDLLTYLIHTGNGASLRIEAKEGKPNILLATDSPDQVARVIADNTGIVLSKPAPAQALPKRQVFHLCRSVARSDKHEVFTLLDQTGLSFFRFLGDSLAITGSAIEFDFKPVSAQLRSYTNGRMDSDLTAYYQGKFPLIQVSMRIYAAGMAEAAHAIAPLSLAGFVLSKSAPENPLTWPHPACFSIEELRYLAQAVNELHCQYQQCPELRCLQTLPYLPKAYANPSYFKVGSYKEKPVGICDGMPTAVLGASRSGKTVLLMNMIADIARSGSNVLVIAPLKHDFRLLSKVLPEDKLTILNINEPNAQLYFNPFAVPVGISSAAWQQHVEDMLVTAGHLDGVLPVVFSNALRTMYSVLKPEEHSLMGLTKCVKSFLARSGYKEKDSLLQASLTRLNLLAASPCFSADKCSFDLPNLLKGGEGKVTVLELEGMPEEYMDAIGGMLIASYMELAKRMPYSQKVRCAFVCDEAHRLTASPRITRMLVGGTHEIRAYGGSMIFADQRVELLGHELFSMGCKHHIILRTACMDELLTKYMDLPIGSEKIIENLVPGQGILKTDGNPALPIQTASHPRLMTTAEAVNTLKLTPHLGTPYNHCTCRYPSVVCTQLREMAAHACEALVQSMPKEADKAQKDMLIKKTGNALAVKAMEYAKQQAFPEKIQRDLATCALNFFRRERLLRRQ